MRVLHGLLARLICSVSTLKWILQHAAVAMVFSSSLKFFLEDVVVARGNRQMAMHKSMKESKLGDSEERREWKIVAKGHALVKSSSMYLNKVYLHSH